MSTFLVQDKVVTPTTPQRTHGTPPTETRETKKLQDESPSGLEVSAPQAILIAAKQIQKAAENLREESFSTFLGTPLDWAIRDSVLLMSLIAIFPAGVNTVTFTVRQESGSGAQPISFSMQPGDPLTNLYLPFKKGIWFDSISNAAVQIIASGKLLK